jgi:hypothetical protein
VKTLLLLEDADKVEMTDYCRPLRLIQNSWSDSFDTTNEFGGSPINNFKWTLVSTIYGDYWDGKTVGEINAPKGHYGAYPSEFIRGEIPDDHILKEND